ncbi:MAG: PQQ-binding-like beta-propeller repeat protein [Pirellulaceae bacterium]|nr:PQQ-binding-like beta-propeller repeat protein [Pirellulaceae bacterium]
MIDIRRRFSASSAALAAALLLMSPTRGAADDWPQFRGPGGQGHAQTDAAPLQWSESEHIRWKTPIEGRAWSSPVVLGDRIWLTTAIETPAAPEQLRAALDQIGMPVPSPHLASRVLLKAVEVDRQSGRVLRDILLFDIDRPVIVCSTNSYASPTPVVEADRLYCDFGTLGTVCLDTSSGNASWTRRLEIEHQVGPGSSPLIHGDLLVLVRDGCDRQYVTALDKHTGRTVWTADRPPMATSVAVYRKAFSTPLVIEHDGTEQLVIPGAQWMVAYEPATGRELWRVDTGPTFSNSARPVYANGLVFCGTAYGGSFLLAIRPDGQGDVTQTHVAWQTQRSVPKRSSPLVVDGHLYMVADNGIATCLDASSGSEHWTERLGGSFSAAPVAAAGRIYLFSEDGTTTVIQPGTPFRQLAANKLDGRIMATPAFVDSSIFLRTDTHLYRID